MIRRSPRLAEKKEMAAAAATLVGMRSEVEEPPADIDMSRYTVCVIVVQALLNDFADAVGMAGRLCALEILMNYLLDTEGQYFMAMCPQRVHDSLKKKVQEFSEADVAGTRVGFKLGRVWQLYFA